MIEHRRIALAAGVLTDDPDWLELRTLPTFGGDLEAGEVVLVTPRFSRVAFKFELYDGMTDGAAPIVGTAGTVSIQFLTHQRNRGVTVYDKGLVKLACPPQQRLIEREVPKQGLSWLRFTTSAGLPAGALAIWVWAMEISQ